jgi:hypothetical protein
LVWLEFIAPTEYESGAPLPALQIADFLLECSGRAAQYVGTVSPVVLEFEPGRYGCTLRCELITGALSEPSAPHTLEVGVPNAPTELVAL